ncbi:MAG: HlyD family efflux transporter periplasmic adaptor subunit [Planctomycetes bacterium]|nr:HlyD family efflux transporter periplasmic adaptor subunit [Planctomycetota bacterium]
MSDHDSSLNPNNPTSPTEEAEEHFQGDEEAGDDDTPTQRAGKSALSKGIFVLGNILLPLGLAGACVYAYVYLMDTAPTAKKGERQAQARLVEYIEVEIGDQEIVVEERGNVMAARTLELKPLVSGQIEKIDEARFQLGGHFKAGETIANIEKRDYELALKSAEQEVLKASTDISVLDGDLERARAALAVELGRQEVARKEYELLGREVTDSEQRDRLLRGPQLREAQAAVNAALARIEAAKTAKAVAENRVAMAKLDLERTEIKAPFAATVVSRNGEVGANAATNQAIATLVGTDAAHIVVTVPSESLAWLKLPTDSAQPYDGSTVRVYDDSSWPAGVFRNAEVLRILPERSESGRQARVLLEVKDPFSLKPENASVPKLLLGSFVRCEIIGRPLKSASRIPRDVMHERSTVWIASPQDKLEIRTVAPIYKTKEFIFLSSDQLKQGERIIVTNLQTPTPGLALRPRLADAKPNEITKDDNSTQPKTEASSNTRPIGS